MKVLVVDDEAHITHMLRVLFQKRGHQVVVADNGESALDLVHREQPDVMFLDLNLPGKNGFQVCEELRREPQFQNLPIFILTAQGQDVDRERGMAVGATDYITKPFSPSHLAGLVQQLAERSPSAQA